MQELTVKIGDEVCLHEMYGGAVTFNAMVIAIGEGCVIVGGSGGSISKLTPHDAVSARVRWLDVQKRLGAA